MNSAMVLGAVEVSGRSEPWRVRPDGPVRGGCVRRSGWGRWRGWRRGPAGGGGAAGRGGGVEPVPDEDGGASGEGGRCRECGESTHLTVDEGGEEAVGVVG